MGGPRRRRFRREQLVELVVDLPRQLPESQQVFLAELLT
jgi:hypothetical protein